MIYVPSRPAFLGFRARKFHARRFSNVMRIIFLLCSFLLFLSSYTAIAQELDLPPDAESDLSSSSNPKTQTQTPTQIQTQTTPATSPVVLPMDLPLGLGVGDVDEQELMRGLMNTRLNAGKTVVGGYGQFSLNYLSVGPDAPFVGTATVRRLVLFVSHNFADWARAYTEFEWENAVACRTCSGSVEIEQAFVEMDLIPDAMQLRSGLILVPFGVINQWHEPPVFHGVERPRVEEGLIPSTWRELGVGIAGDPIDGLHYELYAMTAPDATRLSSQGLLNARTNASLTPANAGMLAGRIEFEPFLGFIVGTSGIAGDLGDRLLGGARYYNALGKPRPLFLPLYGIDFDARIRRSGIEARALYTSFWMPASGDLMNALRSDGSRYFAASSVGGIPTQMQGGSVEFAYDLLYPFAEQLDTAQQLLPFVRMEVYDTQAAMPEGFTPDPFFFVVEYTFGLSYRPLQQLVFKTDFQLRNRRLGFDEMQLNFGMGMMF